jgi:rRNA-processing protein FCF1
VTRTAGVPHTSYLERLLVELDSIHEQFKIVLDSSGIKNIDPNRSYSGPVFIGYLSWGWEASDTTLEAARMKLLGQLRDWMPRLRLLFPHPTPTVAKRLDDGLGHLKRWLTREPGDHSIPPGIPQALAKLASTVDDLRTLGELLPSDEHPVRLVVDTNVLIDNPDLSIYIDQLGGRYRVHLLPVVLGELDDLKRSERTPELRESAKRADRRLKGLRDRGDVRSGVRVVGNITAVFEYIEPKADDLPSWLDLEVPDDRCVASSLLLQSAHAGSMLYVATRDLNLQNKLGAVGLPFIEPLEVADEAFPA